jgi:dipeptidyl aminopeptidase/acylaminoacyl peptidase
MERREVSLAVEGIDIVGEIYLPEGGKENLPALCICHGIPSGSPPDPTDAGYPALAKMFCAAGFVSLIFNFRGTGASGGNFDILGWVKDLEAAIDYLYSCPGIARHRLYLMGFSGGAAVSACVAARDSRVSKVVLCACPAEFRGLILQENVRSSIDHFRRIGIIRDRDFPSSVDDWLQGFRYVAPLHWIDKIAPRPLLLLQGSEDDVVDVSQAWLLYHKAKEPKEIAVIKGAGHRLRLNQQAMDSALKWLKRELP